MRPATRTELGAPPTLDGSAPARDDGRSSGSLPEVPLEQLLSPRRWQRRTRSPELKKALGFIEATVGDARRLLAKAEQRSVDCRPVKRELLDLLSAHDADSLRIDSAWELYSGVKKTLLLVADRAYVSTLLEYEAVRTRMPGRWHGWGQHFAEAELTRLRRELATENGSPDAMHQAVERLGFLYVKRAEAGRERRAKAAQKCRYLYLLAPVLLALLAALAAAIDYVSGEEIWPLILMAATAGAVGSVLSGTLKLRDELVELDDLRSFMPTMSIQPLVGAAAGLVLLLVIESGTIELGGSNPDSWAVRALVAFAAGFSEPFFLGVVQRVARVPDKRPAGAAA